MQNQTVYKITAILYANRHNNHIETIWSHVDGLITFDSLFNNRVNKMNNKQLKIDVDDDVTWSERMIGFLDVYPGGWPTVTVASWHVLGPIVMCVYIVPEEGEERRSGRSHFFFFFFFLPNTNRTVIDGKIVVSSADLLTLPRINLVNLFSDFPCFRYPKSVAHGEQLRSHNRSAPPPRKSWWTNQDWKKTYLGSVYLPGKYVLTVCFESAFTWCFTRMISTLKYKCPRLFQRSARTSLPTKKVECPGWWP